MNVIPIDFEYIITSGESRRCWSFPTHRRWSEQIPGFRRNLYLQSVPPKKLPTNGWDNDNKFVHINVKQDRSVLGFKTDWHKNSQRILVAKAYSAKKTCYAAICIILFYINVAFLQGQPIKIWCPKLAFCPYIEKKTNNPMSSNSHPSMTANNRDACTCSKKGIQNQKVLTYFDDINCVFDLFELSIFIF